MVRPFSSVVISGNQHVSREEVLAIAGITVPNEASVAIHTRFGFEPAGLMHDVGRKFGRYWDVLWMERRRIDGP